MCARRFLDLPRVVVLGVRRGVHHHVARLNLSRFFRLRGLPRGWENSYLSGSCGERSGTTQGIIGVILIMWYQSARLITASLKGNELAWICISAHGGSETASCQCCSSSARWRWRWRSRSQAVFSFQSRRDLFLALEVGVSIDRKKAAIVQIEVVRFVLEIVSSGAVLGKRSDRILF